MDEIKQFLMTRKKANLTIVIINIVVFIVLSIIGDTTDGQFMVNHGAAFTPYILAGDYYRLFTSMFLHFGLSHIVYNMLCLIFLGDILETLVGPVRYLIIYFVGGLAGNLLSMQMDISHGLYQVSAGASGAIFAVVGAIFYILLRHKGRIGTITLRRLLLMIVLTLGQGFTDSGTDNAAHIGGLVAGFVVAVLVLIKYPMRMVELEKKMEEEGRQ